MRTGWSVGGAMFLQQTIILASSSVHIICYMIVARLRPCWQLLGRASSLPRCHSSCPVHRFLELWLPRPRQPLSSLFINLVVGPKQTTHVKAHESLVVPIPVDPPPDAGPSQSTLSFTSGLPLTSHLTLTTSLLLTSRIIRCLCHCANNHVLLHYGVCAPAYLERPFAYLAIFATKCPRLTSSHDSTIGELRPRILRIGHTSLSSLLFYFQIRASLHLSLG